MQSQTTMPVKLSALLLTPLLCIGLLFLSACGDKEPEQRAVFIKVLNDNILSQSGLRHRGLNEEQVKAVGQTYAEQYALLSEVDKAGEFNKAREVMSSVQKLHRDGAEPTEKQKQYAELIGEVNDVIQIVEKEQVAAKSRQAALKQPDDLKAVYDRAYDKMVLVPLEAFREMLAHAVALIEAASAVNDYIVEHPGSATIRGGTLMIEDQKAEKDLMELFNAQKDKAKALEESVGKLNRLKR